MANPTKTDRHCCDNFKDDLIQKISKLKSKQIVLNHLLGRKEVLLIM